jgi:hypothetical protein
MKITEIMKKITETNNRDKYQSQLGLNPGKTVLIPASFKSLSRSELTNPGPRYFKILIMVVCFRKGISKAIVLL